MAEQPAENPPTPYDTGLGDTPPVRIWAAHCFPSSRTGASCGDWFSDRSPHHVFEYVRADVAMRAIEEKSAELRAEIARLTAERDEARAERDALAEALRRIASDTDGDADLDEWGAAEIARDALARLAP